ncbi:hypothetical protein D3C76_1422930 [compost metagenome]
MGKALAEHLAQAGAMGNHCHLLAFRVLEDLRAQQQVVTENRQGIDLDPAIGIGQLRQRLPVEQRCLAAIEDQQVLNFG